MADSQIWDPQTDTYVLYNGLTEEEKLKYSKTACKKGIEAMGYEIIAADKPSQA